MASGGDAGGIGAMISSMGSSGLKKVAFMVIEWIMKRIGMSGGVPGAKGDGLSAGNFMGMLKDGNMLGQLANVLSPGAIPMLSGDSKQNQMSNLMNFFNFAKDKGGVSDDVLPNAGDVNSGKKSALPGMLGTLASLGGNAQSNFNVPGLDMNSIAEIAAKEAGKNAISGFFGKMFGK